MPDLQITTYAPSRLGELTEFWNREFADRPNFFPVTSGLLQQRIFEIATDTEVFFPGSFLMAYNRGNLAGCCHYSSRPPFLARRYYSNWPNGNQGYIAFLHVTRTQRKRGIGSALLSHAISQLAGCAGIVVDGQCFNPFYGNSLYPHSPLWGTPEGISVLKHDFDTVSFFAKRGYPVRFEAVTYQRPLACPVKPLRDNPPAIQHIHNATAELGLPVPSLTAKPAPYDFDTWFSQDRGLITGYLTTYMAPEWGNNSAAIYELRVFEDYQGQGIGSALMHHCLKYLAEKQHQSLQALTVPSLSPNGPSFYETWGFSPIHHWAIF